MGRSKKTYPKRKNNKKAIKRSHSDQKNAKKTISKRKSVSSKYDLNKKCKVADLSVHESNNLIDIEIQPYLENLAKIYSSNLEIQVIGESKEERPIYLAIINQNDSEHPKYTIFIEAGSNGEDSIAIASALYLIKYLAKKCTCNQDAGNWNYFIIPCSNPDAYQLHKCGKKPSLNLTTNFPLRLGNTNIENVNLDQFLEAAKFWKENYVFPCPERLALIKAVITYGFAIKLFVSLQEEGKKIVFSYGVTNDPVPDIQSIREVALAGTSEHFACYPIGSIYEQCGLKFGTIIDFLSMFQTAIRFPYIIHINDKNCKCNSEDIPALAEEVLSCINSMGGKVLEFCTENEAKNDDSDVRISLKKKNQCNYIK